jgi:hypothetical protein
LDFASTTVVTMPGHWVLSRRLGAAPHTLVWDNEFRARMADGPERQPQPGAAAPLTCSAAKRRNHPDRMITANHDGS